MAPKDPENPGAALTPKPKAVKPFKLQASPPWFGHHRHRHRRGRRRLPLSTLPNRHDETQPSVTTRRWVLINPFAWILWTLDFVIWLITLIGTAMQPYNYTTTPSSHP